MRLPSGGPRRAALALAAALGLARCAPAPKPVTLPSPDVYALRDPRAGAPVTLEPRDERAVSELLAALARGEAAGVRSDAAALERRRAAAPVFRLLGAYADLVEDRVDTAAATLDGLLVKAPEWTAALEARADLAAHEGAFRGALDGYRKALRTLPEDARLRKRAGEMSEMLAARLSDEAGAALARRDLEAARRAGFALLELSAADPRGFRVLAESAAAAERWDDAYGFAERARAAKPDDAAWSGRTAELAARSGRHGEAAALWEALAESDPEAAGKAESERLAFRIQNLPESARRAAESPRLTRAQAAALAYWLVPEIRESPVPAGTDVATDVVDRFDRPELVHAIALGLLTVSETHHVQPDAVLSRADLAGFLRRLAGVVGRGRGLPACLQPEASAASLVECGILGESSGRSTSGREAVGAVERTVRAGREGALR